MIQEVLPLDAQIVNLIGYLQQDITARTCTGIFTRLNNQ